MPAIDLARLKIQTSKLADFFDHPVLFLQSFEEILEHYTNRTIRENQAILRTDLASFNTPNPIIHQIFNEIGTLSDQKPVSAVNLTLTLWKASIYESRLLAAYLLGTIPPEIAVGILTKVPEWLYETRDQNIKNAILTNGLARLRKENPKVLSIVISEWLNAPGPKTQTWGLHALIPLIKQVGYDDIPPIFEILRPAIESVSPSTQMDVIACINALDSISHVETIFYLTEILHAPKNIHIKRTFLRMLRGFTPELQSEISAILK
jgi:hypothetical protein